MLQHTINELDKDKLDIVGNILYKAKLEGSSIFLMGNGGSASTCNHMCNDFMKISGLKVFSLVNVPVITAYANDISYDSIFVEQLKTVLSPRDIVIGISGSGNSVNVLEGLRYANTHGGITIGLLGFDGGKAKDIAKYVVLVKSKDYGIIEDLHLSFGHYLSKKILDKK